ncbi:hypothetical protein ACP70R_000563 [Stipagrostis hirtigluma subsp. patula]
MSNMSVEATKQSVPGHNAKPAADHNAKPATDLTVDPVPAKANEKANNVTPDLIEK